MEWIWRPNLFVAFQDADDFWHLDKLKIQYPYLVAGDVHLICTAVRCYEDAPEDIWDAQIKEDVLVKPLTRDWVLWRNVMVTISVIIRNDTNYRFCANRRRGADMELWLNIVLSGKKALFITTPLAYTRKLFYGAGGLSKDLLKAELAQQKNLSGVRDIGFISAAYWMVLSFWSYLKYMRRCLIVFMRVLINAFKMGMRT